MRRSYRSRLWLRRLEDRVTPTVNWTGNAGDSQWTSPNNWSPVGVPGAGADVVINTGASVYYTGAGTSINSLNISNGYLYVDANSMNVTAGLTVGPTFLLAARNSGTTFTAGGTTTINGGRIYAQNGATTTLNGLTSVTGNTTYYTTLEADGGLLDLPNLTSITGTNSTYSINVEATGGGTVNMNGVTTLNSGSTELNAHDAGSVINANALKTVDFNTSSDASGNLYATDGGQLNVSAMLTKINHINFHVDGAASFPTGQLTDITLSTVNVVGGTVNFGSLTTLTGSNFYAEGGSSVTVNNLVSLTGSASYSTYLRSDSGSSLSLPSLTTVNLNSSIGYYTQIQAINGGTLTLGALTKLDTGYVELLSQDANSHLNMPMLGSVTLPGNSYGYITAVGGGQISVAASFTKLNSVDFNIDSATAFPVDQLTESLRSNIYVTGGLPVFTHFAKFDSPPGGYNTIRTQNAGTVASFPALTMFIPGTGSYSYLQAQSGSTLSAPILASISGGFNDLNANGANSVLDLPGLNSVSFNSGYYGYIEATDGGKINVGPNLKTLDEENFYLDSTTGFPVGQLTSITNSNVYVRGGSPTFTYLASATNTRLQTENAGTSASYPALVNFISNPVSSFSDLLAYSGSTLSAGALATLNTGNVQLSGQGAGSVLDLPMLSSIVFPNVSSYQTYGYIYATDGGQVHVASGLTSLDEVNFSQNTTNGFPDAQLTSISNSNVYLQGGSPSFTKLTTVTNSRIETDYVGTTANFPALVNVVSNPVSTFSYLFARNGSTLSAPVLTTLNSGNVELDSREVGSILNLPALASISFPNVSSYQTYGYIYATGGGQINVAPGLTTLDEENFFQDTTTGFPDGQLTSITTSNVYIQGGSPTFTKLASTTNTRIEADYGGTVATFPVLTSFISNNGASSYLLAYSGAKLSAPALTTINTGTAQLQAYADSGSPDYSPSILDLPALTTFTSPVGSYGYLYSYYNNTQINTAANLHLANLSFQFDDQSKFNFSNLQLDSNVTTQGFGKLPGNVTNDGFLDVGYYVTKTLEITGKFTQTSTGTLRVDLAGTAQGTQYDWLKVNGAAQLNGTVTVQYLSGYVPNLMDSFVTVSGASLTGSFVNYNNLLIGGGHELSPTYDATSFKLTTVVSTGPYVSGFAPTGTVLTSVDHLDVTFNKPINMSTVTAPEVVVTGPGGPYTLTSIGNLGGNTYRIYLPTLVTSGTYSVSIGPDITSISGAKMDQNQNGTLGENPGDIFTSNFIIATDDMIVQSIGTIPSNANFGQTFNVPYVVQNIGNAATPNGASWYDYVYLSTDTVFDGGDIYVGYGNGAGLPVGSGGTYNGTATVTLPLNPAQPDGNYYLIVRTNANGGLTEVNTANNNLTTPVIAIKTPPRVTDIGVNGGDPQRSRVNSFSVTFNQIVTFTGAPVAAFTLTRTGPGGPTGPVTLVAATPDNSSGATVVNFTFPGPSSLYTNGSLIDGRYQVKVFAAQVHSSVNGLALDGDQNGITNDDYMLDSTGTTGVFRLYGDVNGDSAVGVNDFVTFRQYFNSYLFALDFDNDNAVAASDFTAFRQRFNTTI